MKCEWETINLVEVLQESKMRFLTPSWKQIKRKFPTKIDNFKAKQIFIKISKKILFVLPPTDFSIKFRQFNFFICRLFHNFFAVMTDNAFKAKDIGLRAQKKLLSRMASKNVAKVFIDGTTASLLDNVYRLVKQYVSIWMFPKPTRILILF